MCNCLPRNEGVLGISACVTRKEEFNMSKKNKDDIWNTLFGMEWRGVMTKGKEFSRINFVMD